MQRESIGHKELFTNFRKGLRSGNWRKLSLVDKALYRASLWYCRNVKIVSALLVKKLSALVEILVESPGMGVPCLTYRW